MIILQNIIPHKLTSFKRSSFKRLSFKRLSLKWSSLKRSSFTRTLSQNLHELKIHIPSILMVTQWLVKTRDHLRSFIIISPLKRSLSQWSDHHNSSSSKSQCWDQQNITDQRMTIITSSRSFLPPPPSWRPSLHSSLPNCQGATIWSSLKSLSKSSTLWNSYVGKCFFTWQGLSFMLASPFQMKKIVTEYISNFHQYFPVLSQLTRRKWNKRRYTWCQNWF